MIYNIAIDGPAGAGKSTIAKKIAGELQFIYVDTGAMYRAVALHLLRNGVDGRDGDAIAKVCRSAEVSIAYRDGEQRVILNGEDVTAGLRTEEVSRMASLGAANPAVREKLLSLQRELAATRSVVMDGRDIGTTVLPGADVKIYLTASSQARADRRYLELKEKGVACDPEEIRREIEERDERDTQREISPLRQAEDAVLVDSSHMTIEEVTQELLRIFREKTGGKH